MRPLLVIAALLAPTTAWAQADPRAAVIAQACRPDGRLLPAAALALDGGDVDDARDRTRAAGLWAAAVFVATFDGGATAEAEAIARWVTSSRDPRFTPRCALAIGGDGRAAVALAPRALEAIGDGEVRRVALPAGAIDPRLVARDEADVVRERALGDGDVSSCDAPSDCQVVARLGDDVTVLARWGRAARSAVDGPLSERELVADVNRARRARGLASLRHDPMLARLARERASSLADLGRVTHAVAPGDAPTERVARAGLRFDALGENVARARSLGEAHGRLMASPSHRRTLMHPGLDAIGVGVARGAAGLYVVELVAGRPSMRGP
ncbi:MAG: CAP domain-containing protein [Polyangiales bacterium]